MWASSGKSVFIAKNNSEYRGEVGGAGCENATANSASSSDSLIRAYYSHTYGSAILDILYDKSNQFVVDVGGFGVLRSTSFAGLVDGNLRIFSDVENTDNYRCYVFFEIPNILNKSSSDYNTILNKNINKPSLKMNRDVSVQKAMQMCELEGLDQLSQEFKKCVLIKM